MPHAHHAEFEAWFVLASLILTALFYIRGWFRIGSLDLDTIEGWRAASFLVGLFLIWAAVGSPLAGLDHQLLTVHMVQHLLLMTLAPPLIWFGAPTKPLLYGLPRQFVHVVVSPLLQSEPAQRVGRVLAHPAVCWLGAAASLVVWHIPAVFMLGLRSGTWHGIEHASFLVTGLLFWRPLVRRGSTESASSEWSLLVYLFLATLPCDILSGFLVFCDRVVYPVYFSSSHLFALSALEDQQCAGALMWTCVTVVYLIAGTIFTMRLLSPSSSRQYAASQSGLRPGTTQPGRPGTEVTTSL